MSEWQELKKLHEVGAAMLEGWEIECKRELGGEFAPWAGVDWFAGWQYRARPKHAAVMVTSLCWRHENSGVLCWRAATWVGPDGYVRFPAGDIEGEVEE